MGGYTRAVSGQWLGKHVPTARDTNTTTEELLSMWSVLKCYNQGTWFEFSHFCRTVCEERTSAGGSGIAIVGAVIRKRQVTD
jgi:hypothetical protein